MAIDLTADLDAPCPPEALVAEVDDLARYPAWLGIVPRAAVTETGPGEDAAWLVELRGRLGPLARSKRLRMVRSDRSAADDGTTRIRFERHELDGRTHAPWILEATVRPIEGGSRLTMHLRYGGGFAPPLLDRLLRDEIRDSRPRLLALVTPSGR